MNKGHETKAFKEFKKKFPKPTRLVNSTKMKRKPQFTEEELLYIETIMDINSAIGGEKIRQNCEQFMMMKAVDKDEYCKLLTENIMELGEAQLITKSIRNKIEGWRR